MNLFPGQEPNKDIEKGLGDTAGEGKAGTNWKSSTDAYTPPRILIRGKDLELTTPRSAKV